MIRTKNNTSAITEVIAKNPPKKANNSFIFDPSEIKMMSNSPEKKFCSVDYRQENCLEIFLSSYTGTSAWCIVAW